MTNPCEKCPITDKLTFCCGSNPETGKYRAIKLDSGVITKACDRLAPPNGRCEIYNERPEACKGYFCEKVYEMGLNSGK